MNTRAKTVTAIMMAFGLLAMLGTSANAAPKRYTIVGWFSAQAPMDLLDGEFTQPNPEANFNRNCARGMNGSDPRVRVGATFRVVNGNNTVIGKGKILRASWISDNDDTRGNCYYQIFARNLPRSNFFCPLVFGEALSSTSPSEADSKGVIDYRSYNYYFGPNWPSTDDFGRIISYTPESEAKKRNCYTG